MGTYENRIRHKADQLRLNTMLLSAIAGKFRIGGASEASLTRGFKGVKDLSSQTALELDLLLGRLLKMSAAFEPFELRLDDPSKVKEILTDFEAGILIVSVTRHEPNSHV